MPSEPLLRVLNLSRAPMFRDVSFDLETGQMLALVGPSGAGKSTLARTIARQERPTQGEVLLEGRAEWPLDHIQLIFQEPAASLNPRFTAAETIAEPLLIRGKGTKKTRHQEAARWMQVVGLPAGAASKRAHEFSGGERQRLAIARALAAEPKLLILDESLSGLDYRVQAQITGLLRELRHRLRMTCLLISHDVALTARIADRIAVMESGQVVEQGMTAELMSQPRHPCTQKLLAASLALAGSVRP